MGSRNPLRNDSRQLSHYKMYKANKQWVTACTTFLLTIGAIAATNTAKADDVANNANTMSNADTYRQVNLNGNDSQAVVLKSRTVTTTNDEVTSASVSATNPALVSESEDQSAGPNLREVQAENRIATVHYVYGNGDRAGQQAAGDSQIEFHYEKNNEGNWLWDQTYNEDGFNNGYKVISGNWQVPNHWDNVIASIPNVPGYTAITSGDWTMNTDGTQSRTPANQFVYPTYVHGGSSREGDSSTAYKPGADTYEATDVHTVYYLQNVQETRTITEHFHLWKNGHDAGQAVYDNGDPIPDESIEVFFENIPTGFATHHSNDTADWIAKYGQNTDGYKHEGGNWHWNKLKGDASTPGYHVISGTWSGTGTNDREFIHPRVPGYWNNDVKNYSGVMTNPANDINSFSFYRPDNSNNLNPKFQE